MVARWHVVTKDAENRKDQEWNIYAETVYLVSSGLFKLFFSPHFLEEIEYELMGAA